MDGRKVASFFFNKTTGCRNADHVDNKLLVKNLFVQFHGWNNSGGFTTEFLPANEVWNLVARFHSVRFPYYLALWDLGTRSGTRLATRQRFELRDPFWLLLFFCRLEGNGLRNRGGHHIVNCTFELMFCSWFIFFLLLMITCLCPINAVAF